MDHAARPIDRRMSDQPEITFTGHVNLSQPSGEQCENCGLSDLLGEHLARAKDVGPFFEDHRDDREAIDGFGPQRFHIAEAIDGRLDVVRCPGGDLG